ncbi:protein SSUH2 homolog isoform X2 [Manihot esculenta]|uniref:protein SSUH2 homolog isoform X2 n=1 Tax=Manihot esculenta TaxID=3983 RepID=UPI001CC81870|nr:protein SSUH2 homolog isoform X2 [Manihot esculenta]
MEEPLLSEKASELGDKESERWSSYQYVGRTGSAIPTASLGGTEVSVEEIRSAAASEYYPPSLHAALISSPEPDPNEQAIVYQGGYGGEYGGTATGFRGQILDEVEIRELLIDHVGHRCCWGSRPARTWKIHAVEDCNVYVGTLDTFIEERETIRETKPYIGGDIDGKDKGPELGVWELDLRSQFPVLFTPHKETRARIPHSEIIEKCTDCEGRGNIICRTCNANQEPGFYKENQMLQCPACYGRGLIAHRDGSDTMRTLSTRKVSATSGAASVPDDVFHRARGIQLCNTQAYQCTPAFFADSFFLNKFSSEVIAERASVPPTARVICERHIISVVPVTRVTMAHRGRSFSFYIIGFSREVYLKDYYPARFCWGLCPCLEWLKL